SGSSTPTSPLPDEAIDLSPAMAEKSLVNEVALMGGAAAAVVAVVADPPLEAAVVAVVVADDDDFFELLQPRSPMEATIATDIRAARLRGTDMLVPPYWRRTAGARH